MKRVTNKQLEAQVEGINILTNSPKTSYTKLKPGKYKANINNFHLDYAYGGVALHRMNNLGGGVIDLFHGHYSKRELSEKLYAFVKGLEYANK